MKLAASILLLALSSVRGAVTSLTPANYESLTDGKIVFIKFFAPWCGHCKAMAADWEKVAADFAGNDSILIAEIDCTADGKPLCDSNGIRGFPTLKHGDPSSLQDYQGGRSYSELSGFAKENLKPSCSPSRLDLCDGEEKAKIQKLFDLSEEDLDAAIAVEEAKLQAAEDLFNAEVQKLQEKYQSLMSEKDATQAEVKASGLGLMKSVSSLKKKGGKKDEL